jgi:hypothetical protein
MRRSIRWSTAALGIAVMAIQCIRPARTNPQSDPGDALRRVRPIPAHVAEVFDRACRDCHSNDTRWPWYSHIAPVSWFVIDHVNHGRSHFNYSTWGRYTPEDAARLLKNSCELAREGAMPLASYTWMHPGARLSRADVDALCAWQDPQPEAES